MNIEWIVSSSALILIVLLVRFLFRKKIPPCLRYALWLVVVMRLLLPVSISETSVSILNLLPKQSMIWKEQESENGQIINEKKYMKESVLTGSPDTTSQMKEDVIENDIPVNIQDVSEQGLNIKAGEVELNASMALELLWLLGAGAWGSIVIVVNLNYGRRLRRSRKSIPAQNLPVMSMVPVYETQIIQTPCLFGLAGTAVYVKGEIIKDEKTFCYVLCHECMHYRQHDHWWALVRSVCLCVHWFNPLVWLAFWLSKQDGEMACDEKTLEILGDKARIDYGKTLLELSEEKISGISGLRISTAMSGNARQMKERLAMIIKTPGRTIGIQIFMMFLVIILSMVTFTGESRAQEKENQDTESWKMNTISTEGIRQAYWNLDEEAEIYEENSEYVPEYEVEDIIEVNAGEQWVSERVRDGDGRDITIYYCYDENNQLHMERYIMENSSPDAVFEHLDLTYVEDDSPYMLSAIVDETDIYRTLLVMAEQALLDLYQWTGEKVDTACFQVSDMGGVSFGLTPEDISHSRIFFSRDFGADTKYNLSNYEKSISSMYVASGRSVWYSPVLWRVFPKQMDEMTDEEIMIWYLERIPLVKDCKVKSIEKRYEDMWTVQTEDGVWFEVVYDVKLKEIGIVSGPYSEYPVH